MSRALASGALIFALALARSLADGFGLTDESWFLQVVSRLRAGDVLYRDVFFGATPLSVYATAAVSLAAGIDVVAVKIVTSLCFAATAVAAAAMAARTGAAGAAPLVVAGMFLWALPYGNPPYTAMAMTFMVTAFLLLLDTLDRERAGGGRLAASWLAVGALVGLSLGSKHNVGSLALVAVVAAIVFARRRLRTAPVRAASLVAAGAAGAVALVLLPVVLSGAGPAFWEYAVAAKTTYLSVGGMSYTAGIDGWLSNLSRLPSPEAAAGLVRGLSLVLPALALAAALAARRRLDDRARLAVLFSAIAVATAFPRWDRFHMGYAVPLHLAALVHVAAAAGWRARSLLRPASAAAVTAAVLLTLVRPVAAIVGRGRDVSRLPHVTGVLLRPAEQARIEAALARFRAVAPPAETFLLTFEAGYWYLAADLRNPTPFDFPVVTAIGSAGEPWLLARLADGRIGAVCVDLDMRDLALRDVAAFVAGAFERGPDLGPCTMFQAPARPVPGRSDDR
jgi:hypothetical protein